MQAMRETYDHSPLRRVRSQAKTVRDDQFRPHEPMAVDDHEILLACIMYLLYIMKVPLGDKEGT